jgi:hypothetical protein
MQQHIIPQCYLAEFVDPNTPPNYEHYVWIFNKGERTGRKKAPSNILKEPDVYTLTLKSGEKDYRIEETLSNLENKYATIFRTKIRNHIPLTEEEHILLCAFVSVMLQRTLRHKDNIEQFLDELIEKTVAMEKANNITPKESERLKRHRENAHKLGVVQTLPDITELLTKMGLAFLVAQYGAKYITSDDPCNLFNPDLQWQKFYSPGLAQERIEVTLPLSPEIMLCLSWSNLKGYIAWEKSRVEEANRMTVNHCYQFFVASSPTTKRRWFRRYPLDFFFILRIIKNQVKMRRYQWRTRKYYRNVRRK